MRTLPNVGKVLVEVANASECKIVKVDVDDYPEFGAKFKIRGLPLLLLFKDGQIVETLKGFQTFDEIMEKLIYIINLYFKI